MDNHRRGRSGSDGRSKSYSPEQEHQLIAFVLDECGGYFGIEEARDIAARLNKKTASIVAKARTLDLDYRTESKQKPAAAKTPVSTHHPVSTDRPESTNKPVSTDTPTTDTPEMPDTPAQQTTESASADTAVEQAATADAAISIGWLDPDFWSERLSHLAEEWRLRGQGSLWSVRKGDLLFRLRTDAALIADETLFDQDEVDARRETLRADLESSFLESMTDRLRSWPQLMKRRTLGFDALEAQFRKKGRLAEFQAAAEEYREREEQIATTPVADLFERSTITERRFQQMAPARRAAFEAELGQIETYDGYIETLNQLPEEEIDDRLAKLQSEFLYVRRARAWAFDFEKLMNDAAETRSQPQGGGNEPPLRLLQNDFLLVMEQRLTLYWRLHQLREKAFAESRADIIRRLSYLESGIVAMHRRNANPELCDRTITEFLNSLEKPATKKTARQTDAEKAAFLKINHNGRQSAWAEFKLRGAQSAADVARRFNELKDIVRYTPEWIQEYKIFRAELLLQRSMDAGRKNSTQEIEEVRQFIDRIASRIEIEIEIDILYRTLEQQLTIAGDVGNKLRKTNQQITKQIKACRTDEIPEIKRAFLEANGVPVPAKNRARVVSMHNWRT